MKILIVNTYAHKGGASRAARRLEAALSLSQNVEVNYLSIYDGTAPIYSGLNSLSRSISNRVSGHILSGGRSFFSRPILPTTKLVEYINNHDCDVVNLHWVNSGALHIKDISKIDKPVIWSLHDMWPFTGGCHYDNGCEGYINGCGTDSECQVLKGFWGRKLAASLFVEKHSHYKQVNSLTMIGLSDWMATCAKSSRLADSYDVVNLPNPIDIDVFAPSCTIEARKSLDLPLDCKLILFGAMSPTEERKGFKQLIEALSFISEDNTQIVIFGNSDKKLDSIHDIPVTYLGAINDDGMLAKVYSASDVMVVPSLQENLSNAVMESLSCSTPVVAFDIGGNSDMVDHKINGYLAKEQSVEDLATGIEYVLYGSERQNLSLNARKKVIENFSYQVVSERYLRLLKSIL